MIGLFDSGLGGLSVVKRVRERLPNADLVFFADQAHVPYGERSEDDLHSLVRANVAWLDGQGVEAIVMACNTSCAIADNFGWPATRARIFDLLDAAAEAVAREELRRIGVVATTATVRTGAYARRIRARIPGVEVTEIAAPALVPLVEAGAINFATTRTAVEEVCARLPPDLDLLVYGCTHYPVLDAHFAAALGPAIRRIDPAVMQAERVAALLGARTGADNASTRYITNGNLETFRVNVIRFTGESSPNVLHALATPA